MRLMVAAHLADTFRDRFRNRMSIQKAVNFTESMEQVVNSQNTATYKLQ